MSFEAEMKAANRGNTLRFAGCELVRVPWHTICYVRILRVVCHGVRLYRQFFILQNLCRISLILLLFEANSAKGGENGLSSKPAKVHDIHGIPKTAKQKTSGTRTADIHYY